jgi:hypothetical protein
MKGILNLALVAVFVGIGLIGSVFLTAFTGGTQVSDLFGWGDDTLLGGVEKFFITVYNSIVVLSSWVTIIALFVAFIGIQGVFVFAYYKIGSFALKFRKDFEKVLNELLDI